MPVADCRVFKVRKDACIASDGREGTFFVIEDPDWVNVVAITESSEIVLIRQFRHGTGSVITEIPGGLVDDGEDPLDAAKRELSEETGYRSDNWVALGRSFPNPALQNNTIHHFLALDCVLSGDTNFDEHESIVTFTSPFHSVREMVQNGQITHSLAITALYFAEDHLRK